MRDSRRAPLPDPILRLLAAVRRQTRAWVVVEAAALLAIAGVVTCWGACAIDRLVEPPAWVRATAAIVVVAAAARLVVTRLVARLTAPLTDEALSLAVERAHPEVGDAISTFVCCSAAGRQAAAVDPELVARTTAEAIRAVALVDPGRLFRRRRLLAVAIIAATALGGTVVATASRPGLACVWLRRLVLLSDEAWPRRVRLAAEQFASGRCVVARGTDFDVIVRVAAAGRLPQVVELRTRGRGGWRTDRMGTRGSAVDGAQTFGHVLPKLAENIDVEIRAGDARLRRLRIEVADPPAVEAVAITCTPPAYLGEPTASLAASRLVAVPTGSRVEIVATSSKPLAMATAATRSVATDAPERTVPLLGPADADRRTVRLVVDDVATDTEVLLRLTDDDGLVNREPVAVILDAAPDEPPRLAVRLVGVSTVVTPAARLTMTGTISDDHGLTEAAVSLRCGELKSDRPIPRAPAAGSELVLTPVQPEIVPLADLGLTPGTQLAVVVTARDDCGLAGGPQRAEGETWTLDVVSVESLRALLDGREVTLRRRFEAAVADLAKARDLAAADAGTDGSMAAAVARASGETGDVAAAFRDIRGELELNGLLTPEIDGRLVGEVAAPLEAIVTNELAAAARGCRLAADRPTMVRLIEAALAAMRDVVGRMRDLESVNEVIERLRGVIDTQRAIHEDTLEQRRKRGREALESP